ncbi:MAG: site-specific DNA-methyltransferase [Chloroflexi bacterium]|nr:site-specific DNA-methyltransferase [Chloroflexota bacterium]
MARAFTEEKWEQLSLIGEEKEPTTTDGSNGSAFSDPAFVGNKLLPVHRWVPWIAGFSSSFVRDALDRHLPHKGTVLDTFAGVGTTLVEAILLGHKAIGFEINPYAALACRTKLNACQIRVEALRDMIERLKVFWKDKVSIDYTPKSTPPNGFKTRADFYSPKVLHKVLIIQDFIDAIKDTSLSDLFRLAFASTMVRYSNYSYEPSLGRRVSAGREEIDDFPVFQTILDKLREMEEDIVWLQASLPQGTPSSQVINDSFLRYESHLSASSVDLIITSPPYLNNYHYNRNTRPQLYWLGYANHPQDMRRLEYLNFGKFWQTVRELKCVDLEFLAPQSDLAERLSILRALNPDRGIYGGNGWANYAASYFNDCYRYAQRIQYVLRNGGTALVVIGNSILQGISIPTDQYFGEIAATVGLKVVEIHMPRTTRVGNSIIQSDVRVAKAQKSHRLYEAVVELRRP